MAQEERLPDHDDVPPEVEAFEDAFIEALHTRTSEFTFTSHSDNPFDDVVAETFLICDSAQVHSGKLFVVGGGWGVVSVRPGRPILADVAIRLRVPRELKGATMRLGFGVTGPSFVGYTFRVLDVSVTEESSQVSMIPDDWPVLTTVFVSSFMIDFRQAGLHAATLSLEDRKLSTTSFGVVLDPAHE